MYCVRTVRCAVDTTCHSIGLVQRSLDLSASQQKCFCGLSELLGLYGVLTPEGKQRHHVATFGSGYVRRRCGIIGRDEQSVARPSPTHGLLDDVVGAVSELGAHLLPKLDVGARVKHHLVKGCEVACRPGRLVEAVREERAQLLGAGHAEACVSPADVAFIWEQYVKDGLGPCAEQSRVEGCQLPVARDQQLSLLADPV